MAILEQRYPTLYDLAAMPENSEYADMINMLAQVNPVLEDALQLPANRGTYNETYVRTGLPSVTWGRLYKGVPASKGTKQMVKDTPGMANSAAEVDSRLVDIYEKADDKASIRLDLAADHLEAMSQEVALAFFYHDSAVDPAKPTGMAPRFSSLSAENGKQIIDGGGTGANNTSVWIITFDRRSVYMFYPKGFHAGIDRKDRGEIQSLDTNGDKFFVYREDFSWHFGITVRNWQYVARVANIDVTTLTNDAATGAKLINLLTEAYYVHKGRRLAMGKTFMYANTTIVKFLDYQARLQAGQNMLLTMGQVGPNAKEVVQFRGIPVRETDAILNTEARVV